MLAHYFADKEELLAAALRLSHQRVYTRIRERTQGLLGLEAIRALMLEALPLDDERLLEAQIEINFLSLALGNSGLRDLQHAEFERFWDTLHYRVCEAQKIGHIPAGADPSDITHELVILVEGLSQEAVLYPSRTTRSGSARLSTRSWSGSPAGLSPARAGRSAPRSRHPDPGARNPPLRAVFISSAR